MFRPNAAHLGLAVFALSLSACDCGKGTIKGTFGDLGVVWRDAAGERVINRDAIYDFGPALVGQRKTLTLTVLNSGVGKLSTTTLEHLEGAEVAIGPAGTDTSTFEIAFTPQDVEPSGRAEYAIAFTPRSLDGAFEAKVKLSSEGTRLEDSTATITLRGTAERGACDFPAVIDFGKVPVGDTLSTTLAFANPTAVAAEGFVGTLMGNDAALFGVSPAGALPVASMGSAQVTFTFSPTELRTSETTLVVRGAGGCPDVTVTVRGEGSDSVLSWAPTTLVYGHVAPGTEKVLEVSFTNLSNVAIPLSEITSLAPADFYVLPAPGQDATALVIPGGGVPTPLRIVCNPAFLGVRDSSLTFKTPLSRTPMGSVALKCTGGGPRIRVAPAPNLAFGRVGYFPGTGASVARKLNVQNVGTQPPMPDVTANLFLGTVASDGTPGELPLFELVASNAGTAADEFVVSLGSPYDPATGLVAVAGRNFVDLAVTLTPRSLGLKAAQLTIHSNDLSQPDVVIQLTADVQALPPCSLRVSPTSANFGLVTAPNTKDLPITITNLGTAPNEICYLSGVDLAAGSATAYSIVGGPVVEKELQPQEVWTVVVRVAPPGPVPTQLITLTGELTFNVASPMPRVAVPLRTSVGPTCVAITPDPLDFGTVRVGCSSATRTVNVYNVCSTPVSITAFTLPSAGGFQPNSLGCPGTAACPEFFPVSAPVIPTGGLTLAPGAAPLQLQLKYTPLDVGSDTGALGVEVVQSGQSLTYLLGLQGNADTTGLQTDTFRQSQTPKADILLVVDDSCSMGNKQMSLAANFASFIQYAAATNTDYQIGVVTTSENESPCPPLLPCPGVPGAGKLVVKGTVGPILTPSTPNVAQAFSTLINVGTNGSSTEAGLAAATLALTPPRIANENAGFLRVDANLAIVVISDAGDQSAQPVSYYQNRLVNVKGLNRLSMFTFSNIGPFLPAAPMGCSYDSGDASRYLAMVTYTSGVQDEICSTNWSATLQNLGRTAFGYRTQFYLNNTPDLAMGPPQVAINGVPVAASEWSYDSATNSIIFATTSTPGAGQTLTVVYSTTCF